MTDIHVTGKYWKDTG